MKRKLKNTAITIIAVLITATAPSCAEADNISILNAENAGGFIYENITVTINAPAAEEYTETENPVPVTSATAEINEINTSTSTTAPAENSTVSTTTKTTTEKITAQTTVTSVETTAKMTTTAETTAQTTVTSAETAAVINNNSYTPLNYDNVVGVWISYLELRPTLEGKTETQFRAEFKKMVQNCKNFGINTVYVHLRAFGDAFYKSDYYPWSKYITGKLGIAPSFDPLKIMLEEAHALDISFHGWINPLRIQANSDINLVSKNFKIGNWYEKNEDYIIRSGDYWYLNPAYNEVITLVSEGVYEIIKNYNVDGIHIDDYFYPTTDESFDKKSFLASGKADLAAFRFDNCNKLVKGLYNAVKSANKSVLFGISPQGSIENNLNSLYADVELWCKTAGYCDYIAPQVYYGFNNSAQPYKTCLERWQLLVSGTPRKLITGLAVYKIGKEDVWAGEGKNEWISGGDILKRQTEFSKSLNNYGGIIFYSYNYMFGDYVTAAINSELDALKV